MRSISKYLLLSGYLFMVACAGNPAQVNQKQSVTEVGKKHQEPVTTGYAIDTNIFNETDLSKDEMKVIKHSTKYNVIVHFDASCSSCIVDYMGLVTAFKKIDRGLVKYLFIAAAKDKYLLEYHMEKSNIKMNANSVLVLDKQGVFPSANPTVSAQGTTVLLADQDMKVLVVGNPIQEPKIRSVYTDHGLL